MQRIQNLELINRQTVCSHCREEYGQNRRTSCDNQAVPITTKQIPLIVPAIAAPAIVFYMRQYMKSSFPLYIVEAARIDGCSEFRTFISIAIPMMKPAIAVQAIFAFVQNWNNYYTQNMILISNDKMITMPMMVQKVLGQDKKIDLGAQYAAVALSVIPIIVIYV